MKKISIALLLTLSIVAAKAQDFRIGAKGFFNSTWLFNNNISDAGDNIDYASTFGASFGVTSILYFNQNVGVSLDVLYASNNQKLEGKLLGTDYESTVKVKYIDIPILLRMSSEGGAYVEIGPQISLLAGAKEDFAFSPSVPGLDYTDRDVKKYFNSIGLAPVLGFGVDVQASDNMFINIGLRFGYGVTDATKKLTEDELAADGTAGTASYFGASAHTDAQGNYNYHKTNRAFGGFSVGVIYKPGR